MLCRTESLTANLPSEQAVTSVFCTDLADSSHTQGCLCPFSSHKCALDVRGGLAIRSH